MLPTTVLPKQWKDFLRVDDNKTELFEFLSQQVMGLPVEEGKELYTMHGKMVLWSPADCCVANLTPCTHEEADTCLLLHVTDAVQKGFKKVTIHTVDTVVVVLAIALFRKIKPEEMWIAFGKGTSFRHICVYEIANKLDPSTCAALPLFHALTGCDTVSAFAGRGKKTARETWKAFPEVTKAFNEILQMQADVSEQANSQLEHFFILMYDRTSETTTVITYYYNGNNLLLFFKIAVAYNDILYVLQWPSHSFRGE